MVLDGEEDHLVPANEVEEQVLAQDDLSEIVARFYELAKPAALSARLQGLDGVIGEWTTRAGELTEGGDEVIEQVIQQADKGGPPSLAEEFPDGVKVLGEIPGEDGGESPTGHTERATDARSRCGRQRHPSAPSLPPVTG